MILGKTAKTQDGRTISRLAFLNQVQTFFFQKILVRDIGEDQLQFDGRKPTS